MDFKCIASAGLRLFVIVDFTCLVVGTAKHVNIAQGSGIPVFQVVKRRSCLKCGNVDSDYNI